MATKADLIAEYHRLNDEKSELKSRISEIDAKMGEIKSSLARRLDRAGDLSAKTKSGGVRIEEAQRITLTDKGAFKDWILSDPERYISCLQNRVHQEETLSFIVEAKSKKDLPKGVERQKYKKVVITKPRKAL